MSRSHSRAFCALAAAVTASVAALTAVPAGAVIVLDRSGATLGATQLTAAPAPADDAYDPIRYTGSFGYGSGVAIDAHHFITAFHIGNGGIFNYQGVGYAVSTGYSYKDLRIYTVTGTLPNWAPLYTKQDEVGKRLIVTGRGAAPTPGTEIIAPMSTDADQLRGWRGDDLASAGTMSWGENEISDVTDFSVEGDNGALVWTFDRSGLYYEASLAGHDSGGGVFIKDTDGKWKLAGINYGVEGGFSTNGANPSTYGAIFDKGGLYKATQSGYVLLADYAYDRPTESYASRIASNLAFIGSVVPDAVPEPSSAAIALIGAVAFSARRRRNV